MPKASREYEWAIQMCYIPMAFQLQTRIMVLDKRQAYIKQKVPLGKHSDLHTFVQGGKKVCCVTLGFLSVCTSASETEKYPWPQKIERFLV